jgi:hypothetical protein
MWRHVRCLLVVAAASNKEEFALDCIAGVAIARWALARAICGLEGG